MPGKFDKCIKAIVDASKGAWTRDEAKELYNTLENKKNNPAQEDAFIPSNLRDAYEKAASDHVKQLIYDTKLKNFRANLDAKKIKQGVEIADGYKSPKEYVRAFLGGSQKDRLGAKGGVDAAIKANTEDLLKSFHHDLEHIATGEKATAMDLLLNGDLDERILWKKYQLEGGEKTLPEATTKREQVADKVAETYHKYNNYLVDRQNDQGAGIQKLKGRGTIQWNNAANMLHGGIDKWKAFVEPLLDSKTFNGAEPDNFLKSTYDAITTTVRLAREGEVKGASKSYSSSMAGGPSANKERVLHFKDPSAQLRYLQSEYSHGSMATAMLNDLTRGMKNATMFEHMGTDPEAFVADLENALKQDNRRKLDAATTPAERSKYQKRIESLKNTDYEKNILRNLTGYTSIDLNPTVSSFNNAWKTYLQATTQVNALFRVLPDLQAGPSELMIRGMPYLKAHYEYYRGLFESMAHGLSPEKMAIEYQQVRAFQEEFGVALANKRFVEVGGVKGLFDGSRYSLPDRLNAAAGKTNAFLYKWNGLHKWDGELMQASRGASARWLGQFADKPFAELENNQFIRGLRTYGITEPEWEVMRKAAFDIGTKDRAITGDSLQALKDSEFHNYLKSQGRSTSEYNVRQAKNEIGTKLNKYIYDAGYQTILSPDAATRALTNFGLQKGTYGRFVTELIAHMKGFMITNFRKNVGRSLYGYGTEGLTDVLSHPWQNKAAIGMMASNIAQGTVLYMAGDAMYHLATGYTPPDYTRPGEALHVLAGGGGLGLYAELMLKDYGYGMSFVGSVAGPTGGEFDRITNLVSGYKKSVIGEGKEPNSQAIKFAADSIPGMRAAGIAPLLNYLIVNRWRDSVSPGSIEKSHRNREKQTGSRYLLPEPEQTGKKSHGHNNNTE